MSMRRAVIRIVGTMSLALVGCDASHGGDADVDPGVAPGENERCPLDLEAPIPAPECTTARESAAGKWTEASEAIWSASAEPHDVTIVVRGGATVCPAQECPAPPNPCPESGAQHEYMSEWNWQSQRCVRAVLLDLGAEATDEHFWLANVMFAKLTWDQIQAAGAHPHVAAIDRDKEPTPPP